MKKELTKEDKEILKIFLETRNCKFVSNCTTCPVKKLLLSSYVCFVSPNGVWGEGRFGEDGIREEEKRIKRIQEVLEEQVEFDFEF